MKDSSRLNCKYIAQAMRQYNTIIIFLNIMFWKKLEEQSRQQPNMCDIMMLHFALWKASNVKKDNYKPNTAANTTPTVLLWWSNMQSYLKQFLSSNKDNEAPCLLCCMTVGQFTAAHQYSGCSQLLKKRLYFSRTCIVFFKYQIYQYRMQYFTTFRQKRF